MQLERLASEFSAQPALPDSLPEDVSAVEAQLGGTSLDGGLCRWFDANMSRQWGALASEAFPGLAGRIRPFAADWLGRQFALDSARRDSAGAHLILLLDVGAGEALEVPSSLRDFHEVELVEFHDAALASAFYQEWRQATEDGQLLSLSECVGYKVPLFLGGKDAIHNLERMDADVHWTLTGQLLRQVAQ